MNIFVYSDESGVFDKAHNEFYSYGGLVFLSKESRDIAARKFSHAESVVRESGDIPEGTEIKASNIFNKHKGSLYRSLNHEIKFGTVIHQHRVLDRIFECKKSKQRFLDYAYKRAIKACFQFLRNEGRITPETVENIYFFIDEHSTATDGKYELRESLEQEFKYGCFNSGFSRFIEPLFPKVQSIQVEFCNSASKTLVRAADIVANRIGHQARVCAQCSSNSDNLYILELP